MTIGGRIATYTGSAVGIVLVVCLGLIKLSESSHGPKPHHRKYIAPLAITLSVDGNGNCLQQVNGANVNFPEVYVGQGVTWTAPQGWSLTFSRATVLPPNTGTPFEDANYDWLFTFSGTAANPTTPSGASVIPWWESAYYSFSQQVTFKYSALTINGTQCSGPSGMGVIVKTGT